MPPGQIKLSANPADGVIPMLRIPSEALHSLVDRILADQERFV